jgi:hypothetical protein
MAQSDLPGGQAGAGRPRRNSAQATGAEGLYRTVYEESQRTLDDQNDELTEIRQRVVQFVAFVGAATAFLVGTSLRASSKDAVFYWLAAFATSLSCFTLALVVCVLVPFAKWEYRLSASVLIDKWIETDVPVPSEGQFLRALALRYDQMRQRNETALNRLRLAYVAVIVAGILQLSTWIVLSWVKG